MLRGKRNFEPCAPETSHEWPQMNRTSADATESGGRLAYILDDEPDIRELITNIVGMLGFTARAFGHVTALEMAMTEAVPEVIILDLSLGDTDGIDVIRSLAASRFGGAILLISGRHDAKTIDEVRRIGKHHGLVMLPFLQKPFRLDQFKERLRMLGSVAPASPGDALLEHALRNNQLELWYQPKINLATRQMCGAEALIRLRHPTRGILLPAEFLPRPGDALHHPLADFVMRCALNDWLFFAADHITPKLAINMPISIFETPEFVSNLRKYLPGGPMFPGLIVELTEDEVVSDPDLAHEVAIQLKLYNIGVAIDDFGSGHATLDQAQALPFTELKIDRSKVEGCSRTPSQYLECRQIIELAHRLGMTAVAEGIEQADDLAALVAMQCDVGQGAIFAWPMEREEFKEWVARR
jgi:EAL domain-containing protein (putative c-di-GMP-specific phosphodiesterase class I)/ActR/RegA family two-component response regulator